MTLTKTGLQLGRLTAVEYAQEFSTAFKERMEHPDEYHAFLEPEFLEKTCAVLKHSIADVRRQLEIEDAREDRGPVWAANARAAKRHMEDEHARLVRLRGLYEREERKQRRETNDNELVIALLDQIEDLAIRLENLGALPDDLMLAKPETAGGEHITLAAWLDIRELKQEGKQ